jgi:hypothetical protein
MYYISEVASFKRISSHVLELKRHICFQVKRTVATLIIALRECSKRYLVEKQGNTAFFGVSTRWASELFLRFLCDQFRLLFLF